MARAKPQNLFFFFLAFWGWPNHPQAMGVASHPLWGGSATPALSLLFFFFFFFFLSFFLIFLIFRFNF
jgi:hypothetical protein